MSSSAPPSTPYHRGPNFTEREKERLLDIINEFRPTIENKTTNSTSLKSKNRAWDQVTIRFNSASLSARRDTKALKKCYENMKKKARVDLANQRTAIIATGGGPYRGDVSGSTSRVAAMIGPLLEPLPNPFDSDAGHLEGNYRFYCKFVPSGIVLLLCVINCSQGPCRDANRLAKHGWLR